MNRVDFGQQAHDAAVKHLRACWEALNAEQDNEDIVNSPASAPFCGCEDCEVRETLVAAWPYLERHLRQELLVSS